MTTLLEVVEAPWNDAPALIELEGLLALDTVVLGVVNAPRFLPDALLLDFTVVVGRCALQTLARLIELLTVLVLRNTPSIRGEQEVRVALDALAVLGNEAVGELAAVLKQ